MAELRAARAELSALSGSLRATRFVSERASAARALGEHSAEREREWALRDAQPIRGLYGPRPDTCGLASAAYHVPSMRCVPTAVPQPVLRLGQQRAGQAPDSAGTAAAGGSASRVPNWAGVFADARHSESTRVFC